MRKRSFDSGTFTVLTQIHKELNKVDSVDHFAEIRKEIRDKVLNWVDINDLNYHVKVLQRLISMNGTTAADDYETQMPSRLDVNTPAPDLHDDDGVSQRDASLDDNALNDRVEEDGTRSPNSANYMSSGDMV